MEIIVKSNHSCFREYIKRLLSSETNINLIVPKDDDCINVVREYKDAVIILDAHSEKPYSECVGLEFLKKLKKEKLKNRVIMLSWLTEVYTIRYTTHNIINNPCMDETYMKELSYNFEQLPISSSELFSQLCNNL